MQQIVDETFSSKFNNNKKIFSEQLLCATLLIRKSMAQCVENQTLNKEPSKRKKIKHETFSSLPYVLTPEVSTTWIVIVASHEILKEDT